MRAEKAARSAPFAYCIHSILRMLQIIHAFRDGVVSHNHFTMKSGGILRMLPIILAFRDGAVSDHHFAMTSGENI